MYCEELLIYCFLSSCFSLNGYETAFTIKEITEDVIDKLVVFARNIPEIVDNYAKVLNVTLKPVQKKNLLYLFLGLHTADPPNFDFKPADRITILNVVKIVQEELVRSEGLYDVFLQNTNEECTLADTLADTPIGSFFTDKHKSSSKKSNETKNRKASAVIPSPVNVGTDLIVNNEIQQLEYGEKLLRESFCLQMRTVLLTFTKNCAQEIRFLNSCGIKSIEDFTFQVILDDSNIKLFLSKQIGLCDATVSLLASIPCYCAKNYGSSVTAISAYFRPGIKFEKMLCGPPNLEQGSIQLATCWIFHNFLRHLKCHSKFYNNECHRKADDHETTEGHRTTNDRQTTENLEKSNDRETTEAQATPNDHESIANREMVEEFEEARDEGNFSSDGTIKYNQLGAPITVSNGMREII